MELATAASVIDSSAFTATLPRSSVHRSRFPLLRTGKMSFAYSRSFADPPFLT